MRLIFPYLASSAKRHSPAFSPDGRTIAFLRDIGDGKAEVRLVPSIGGPERNLAKVPFYHSDQSPADALSWSPDGSWLAVEAQENPDEQWAIFLLSIDSGELSRLTYPGAPRSDSQPAFSPDGRSLAFVRHFATGVSQVLLLSLTPNLQSTGEPRQLTHESGLIRHPEWTPDGRQIIFSLRGELHRVEVADPGPPKRLAFAGEDASSIALSPQGNCLVYQRSPGASWDIYRAPLPHPDADNLPAQFEPEKFISSTRHDNRARYSPDGRRIAFVSDRSGKPEIWVSDSDGGNPKQLTFFEDSSAIVPYWSSDGQWICFAGRPGGNVDVYVVSPEGGTPKRLTYHEANDGNPHWSQDGKWVYFRSMRTGKAQVWRIPAEGGDAEQITRGGGVFPIAPHKEHLYYTKGSSLWKVPATGDEETQVLDSLDSSGGAANVVEDGIYFIPKADSPDDRCLQFYEFASGNITTLLVGLSSNFFDVSPDRNWILMPLSGELESDLMLVENFR